MEAVVAALDAHNMQLGENGSAEHRWSECHDEQFAQLYFQLVRSKGPSDAGAVALRARYRGLLEHAWEHDRSRAADLYCLIGHVRDVEQKGERQLAYALIWECYGICPDLALLAVKYLVHGLNAAGGVDSECRPLGGWGDVKYLCDAVKTFSGTEDHPLIGYAHDLMIAQLDRDDGGTDPLQLTAKWVPKENTKTVKNADGTKTRKLGRYAWQFYRIARKMFPFGQTATTESAVRRANAKSCMKLRQMTSRLNQAIGTVEVAMSSGDERWGELSFGKGADGTCGHYNVCGATLRRHTKAWKNATKAGETRSGRPDRVACADNYERHMAAVASGEATVRGATLNPYEITKDAAACSVDDATEVARINGQWAANGADAPDCGAMVAICDVSSSMLCDNGLPMHAAVGTAIRISETSLPCLRNRILTFSATPSWIDLSDLGVNFVEKVHRVQSDRNWGMSTDLLKACEMVAASLAAGGVARDAVKNIVLAVLSDMQIDGGQGVDGGEGAGAGGWGDASPPDAHERIEACFAARGLPCPHILWWNLRRTDGFPTVMTKGNTTCVSGYSASLLKAFQEDAMKAIENATPLATLRRLLADERLSPLRAGFERLRP
jgi:hypothetical protein